MAERARGYFTILSGKRFLQSLNDLGLPRSRSIISNFKTQDHAFEGVSCLKRANFSGRADMPMDAIWVLFKWNPLKRQAQRGHGFFES